MKGPIFTVIIVAGLSGCAFNSQTVQLDPHVEVVPSDMGAGKAVGLIVVDERASNSLGRRGTAAIARAAEIKSDRDLAVVVHDKVAAGLKAKGFAVSDSRDEPTELKLELRDFEYSTSTGFWTGGIHVNGAIKAVARRPGDNFEQMYRTENERRVVVVPTAGKNSDDINSGLADLLRKILNDVGLLRFLSGE
jgi:Uncharacterized lipoprotein.